MRRINILSGLLAALISFFSVAVSAQSAPLNIIVIGAHPDDPDICAGGAASMWASMGHNVKFLSLTNGDAGHQSQGGGALAKRRRAEAREAARRLGIAEYETLENHDGELMPSLDVRLQVIRRIRQWNADVVILPRPNDYHPDHRNTGLVVQDAAYMVIVPNVASEVPPLAKNPVFMYCDDRFLKPNPFEPDVAVITDAVVERRIDGLDAHESQFYEWLPWTVHAFDQVPKDHVERKSWLAQVRKDVISPALRAMAQKWYGEAAAQGAQNIEPFEICEYGRQPDEAELRRLFPMLGQTTPTAKAVKVSAPVQLDGRLEEEFYQRAPRIYLKNSMTKEVIADPKYTTYAQVGYSDTHLHLAFTSHDPNIHTKYTKRDEHLWEEEVIEVFIDTDESPTNYVELNVSPRNVIYDSYIDNSDKFTAEATKVFNLAGVQTAVQVKGTLNDAQPDQWWTTEISIPFKDLVKDFNPARLPQMQWKINFYRLNDDAGSDLKYMAWSPTQGSYHQPAKFGTLIFR